MSRQRHKVADTDELPTDGSYVIEDINGREIAVFRVEEEYYAVLNYCVHQGGPLCEKGELTGRMVGGEDGWEWRYEQPETVVTCPWHNWKFDITTGENINDDQYAVPTYQVEVQNDEVYVLL